MTGTILTRLKQTGMEMPEIKKSRILLKIMRRMSEYYWKRREVYGKMNYVGIDIGSTASKVAVIGEKEMKFVLPTGWSSKETTTLIREKLLADGVDVANAETKVAATG